MHRGSANERGLPKARRRLQQSEVIGLVRRDDAQLHGIFCGQVAVDVSDAIADHVVVGHDVAACIDQESSAVYIDQLLRFSRCGAGARLRGRSLRSANRRFRNREREISGTGYAGGFCLGHAICNDRQQLAGGGQSDLKDLPLRYRGHCARFAKLLHSGVWQDRDYIIQCSRGSKQVKLGLPIERDVDRERLALG